LAEVQFVIENEMAIALEDIVARRIRLAFVHQGQCLAAAPRVAAIAERVANWDAARVGHEIGHLERSLSSQLAPAF
jgi:glycerol-3-phosphate dehydrogenase